MVPSPSPNNSSLKDGYIVGCDSLCSILRWIAQWYSDKHGYETGVLTSNMIQRINIPEPQCMFISQGLCALHVNASSKSKLASLSTRKQSGVLCNNFFLNFQVWATALPTLRRTLVRVLSVVPHLPPYAVTYIVGEFASYHVMPIFSSFLQLWNKQWPHNSVRVLWSIAVCRTVKGLSFGTQLWKVCTWTDGLKGLYSYRQTAVKGLSMDRQLWKLSGYRQTAVNGLYLYWWLERSLATDSCERFVLLLMAWQVSIATDRPLWKVIVPGQMAAKDL